jgi:hypothetical protein
MSMAITIFVEDNNNTQSLGRILVSSINAETDIYLYNKEIHEKHTRRKYASHRN